MNNKEIAYKFAYGATEGRSRRMIINGNRLYSSDLQYTRTDDGVCHYKPHDFCIAIRKKDKFIISNKAAWLFGGSCHSFRISQHIGNVFSKFLTTDKDILLTDGWADKGSIISTHKTKHGFIKAFTKRCFGYIIENGQVTWKFRKNKMFDPNGNVVAVRKYIHRSQYSGNCNKQCDKCPAKFMCLTSDHYFGYVFYIVKGEYEKLLTRYLLPYAVSDAETCLGMTPEYPMWTWAKTNDTQTS